MRCLILAPAIIAAAILAPVEAEAARCAKGKIYRPTQGMCQSKQAAIRQGVRVYSRASIRQKRVRRAALPVVITYENHVYNWAYDNRDVIEKTTPGEGGER